MRKLVSGASILLILITLYLLLHTVFHAQHVKSTPPTAVAATATPSPSMLLADVITEAVSNDYQPNNEAANSAYFAELNSNFENGDQRDRSTDQSTAELDTGQVTTVDSKLTPKTINPDEPANATSVSPSLQTASAEVNRPRIGHLRYRSTVRHQMLDVKTRLLALWHHLKNVPNAHYSGTGAK
jgi:hypothetical protein